MTDPTDATGQAELVEQTDGDRLRSELADILDRYQGTPCVFFACPGVTDEIENMATCAVCAMQIEIRALINQQPAPPPPARIGLDVPGLTVTRTHRDIIIDARLDERFATGEYDFHTNGNPVRVTPHRMQVTLICPDGQWRIHGIRVTGYPTPDSVAAGARHEERQRTYGEPNAPAWAVDIARRMLTDIPD